MNSFLMKHKQKILIGLFLAFTYQVYSQKNIYLFEGRIIDNVSSEILIGAGIQLLNKPLGAITNEKGEFKIELNEGFYEIMISYLGYKTDTLAINLNTPSISLYK